MLNQEVVRHVEEPSDVVVFTDSDHASCLKHAKVHHHPNCSVVLTCHVPPALRKEVIALSSGESGFYALVKGISAGLGAVSMLKDLGVDIRKNTKIGKAILEVRVGASVGRGMAVRRGVGWTRQQDFDTSNITKLTKAVLEVRIDASAGRGIAVRRGARRIRHNATNVAGANAHARQIHDNPWSIETGRSWN